MKSLLVSIGLCVCVSACSSSDGGSVRVATRSEKAVSVSGDHASPAGAVHLYMKALRDKDPDGVVDSFDPETMKKGAETLGQSYADYVRDLKAFWRATFDAEGRSRVMGWEITSEEIIQKDLCSVRVIVSIRDEKKNYDGRSHFLVVGRDGRWYVNPNNISK